MPKRFACFLALGLAAAPVNGALTRDTIERAAGAAGFRVKAVQMNVPRAVRPRLPFVPFDFDDPLLEGLRREHRLSEVAGDSRDEWTRQLKLKDWIFRQIPGGNPRHSPRNALEVLRLAAKGEKFYCTQYAITYVECAQALGWPKSRVTARVKVLELPERAQQLIGDGVIALSAVDQLRAIGKAAPALLDAVIAYLDDGNAWAAERLAREPGWVLDAAMRETGEKTFAAYLDSASLHAIAELRLGKKTDALYAEAEKLHRQLDRYAYGPPQVRFTDADVVAQALAHAADAVEAAQDRQRQARLRLLSLVALKIARDHQAE